MVRRPCAATQVLRELQAACRREDWGAVAGMVHWLVAGWEGRAAPPDDQLP
jgi:hypothetical protein